MDLNKKLKPETKREQLLLVDHSLAHLNIANDKLDKQIKHLIQKKANLAVKISKKTKYKLLLQSEL